MTHLVGRPIGQLLGIFEGASAKERLHQAIVEGKRDAYFRRRP